jgi:DNA polymerase-1
VNDSCNDFIYTSFNICATATGRLSSSGPNLQQIPKNKNGSLREIFIPSDNSYMMGCFDFKQMELVMAAHLSKDPVMLDAYKNDMDIHSITASKLFNKSVESINYEERSIAKKANFGLLYGMGAKNFARELNFSLGDIDVSIRQAREIRRRFFDGFNMLMPFYDNLIADAKMNGYLLTEFGTRRVFPFIHFLVGNEVEHSIRKAKNFIIQGTCADILKEVMIRIHKEFLDRNLKSKMILSVHDELVFEIHKSELDILKSLVKEIMENTIKLSIPLKVDFKIGNFWGDKIYLK